MPDDQGVSGFGVVRPPGLIPAANNTVLANISGSVAYLTAQPIADVFAASGGLSYQGAWNASTNTPTLVSSVGTNSTYYAVSVAGSTNLNGITSWSVGDWVIFSSVAGAWQKLTGGITNAEINVALGFNLSLGGNLTTGGAFTTSGSSALTLTTTGATNVTLPTTGTLLTSSTAMLKANDLSDVASVSTSRTNLGLGTAAVLNVGTSANNIVQLTGAGILPAVDGSALTNLPAAGGGLLAALNLSDVASASTSRTNLGLGTAATQPSAAFALVANNLSDLANASTARTNLGLGTAATQASTVFALVASNLSDLANAATARTNLGLGTAATQATSAFLQPANNLSDVGSAATSRTNLGLGTAAVQNVGAFAQVANNLSDLASATTARTNLGLGTAAVQNVGTFAQVANNLSDLVSAATSRVNLGVDKYTPRGDATYSIAVSDKVIALTATLTAPRVWTLPAANGVNAGQAITIIDLASGVSATNFITITRAGADTINGLTTSVFSTPYGAVTVISNGVDAWESQITGLEQGGTGATSASAARTALGLATVASSGSASDLGSGTLPSGRMTGSYTGITGLGTISTGVWNGTDIAVPDGGTGVSTLTGLVKGNGTSAFTAAVSGTDYVPPGAVTSSSLTMATARLLGRSTASTGAIEEIVVGSGLTLSAGTLTATGGGTGTVTDVSVVSTNGFAGSVATSTTTPAITLTTTITGILSGNGTAISAASTTGSGSVVLATSPTLVTPALGAATATTVNGLTITSSTGTLTVTNAKTASFSNTLTFAGTDSSTLNIGAGGTLVASAFTDALNASNISSGTLPSGRISGSYTGLTGTGTLTAGATGAGFTVALTTSTITGTLTGTNGGTNNAFFDVTGPTTSIKTMTFPNANATVLTTNAVVTVAQGGIGVGTLTGIAKGNGTSAFTAAAAATDYVAPGAITSDGITMATARILGRTTASTGAVEEITVGSGLSLSAGALTATGSSLTVGTSAIVSGSTTRILYDNAGVLGEYVITGTGSVAMGTGPSMSGVLSSVSATVSGAGTTQGAGTVLTSDYNVLTTITGANNAVVLPGAAAGLIVTVVNADSADSAQIFPASADAIDALGTNAAITLIAGGVLTFRAISASQWYSSRSDSVIATQLTGTALATNIVTSSLTAVGTISTGVWNGTDIAVADGGTGVSTLTGLAKGNGTSAFTAAAAGTDYVAPGAVTADGITMATARMLGRTTASTGAVEEITVGSGLSLASGNLFNNSVVAIEFIIDGGGSAITTGIQGDLEIPFACTINTWSLLADQSGSIVVDIWKDTYANYPPVVGDTITGSALPTISAATKGQSSTLTGWTTTISAGDTLRYNVNSITTCTRVVLSLKVTRT